MKFDVHKKGEKIRGFYRKVTLSPRMDFKKNSGTLRWLSATVWELIIVTKSCIYRENVLNEK